VKEEKSEKQIVRGFEILSLNEIEEIHEHALRILQEVGIVFHNKEALAVLTQGGATIEGKDLVKFPERLVSNALKTASSEFVLYNRNMTDSFVWGGTECHFGAGGSAVKLLDSDGKTHREPKTEDLLKLYQISDALPEISLLAPGFIVKDVPIDLAGIWRFYLRLKYGVKPSCVDGLSVQDLRDNMELLRVVRADDKSFIEKPFGPVQSCCTPPLTWSEEGAGFLVEAARAQLPCVFMPMPFAGVGAPATVAGSLVQHVAEILSALVLVQLIAPGTPCVYLGAPTMMDMRYGTANLSPMGVLMITAANTQMGRYYNLPTGTGDISGHSDSKLMDFQAGAESALSQLLFALAGNNMLVGLGFLGSQESYSLEKLIADHETCRYVKRLLRGINVSPETIAFDLIKAVGPGGNFLKQKHTVSWYRKEFIFTDVFNREGRATWEATGCKSTFEYARERVNKVLKESSLNQLDSAVDKALNQRMDAILSRRGYRLSNFVSLLPR